MERIGIFGGTFNPPHFGHLRAALEVYNGFDLDRVLFVPSFLPPHKKAKNIAAPKRRFQMTQLAIKGFCGFKASDLEITREEVSYSYDTVTAVKKIHKDAKIFFILGTDAFSELNTWKGYEEFIFLCDFVVMTRPAAERKDLERILPGDICKRFSFDKKRDLYESDAHTRIYFFEITQLDISATNIRTLCKENKSIKYLLPGSVEKYILQNGLYL